MRQYLLQRHAAPLQPISTLKLSAYVYLALSLTLCLLLLCLGVKTIGLIGVPRNPLASYSDILPGHPRSAAEMRGFSCMLSAYGAAATPDQYCVLEPGEGPISQVAVTIDDDTIRTISFRMRDNTLNVGDLIMIWGRPHIQEYQHSVYYYWREQGIFALSSETNGESSLFLHITRVNITEIANNDQ